MSEAASSAGGGNGGSSGPPGQVIIVKKKARGGNHGHHGGAWKVAYADFVTAMMAFFLLLWLLAAASEEQKAGIAMYFNPPNNATEYGGGPGAMHGGVGVFGGETPVPLEAHTPTPPPPVPFGEENDAPAALQANEDAIFKAVAEELKKAVMNIPQIQALLENLVVDVTPEGLRISITDAAGRELFPEGSAAMYPATEHLLGVMAGVLGKMPNRLALGGHTDAVPYRGTQTGMDNWTLSSARAMAMRQVLQREGIPERRIQRVAGFAASEPLLPDEPTHVKNRRLTIVVLRSKQGTIAQFNQDGLLAPQGVQVQPLTAP